MTNTFGRVFFGWLADCRWFSALAITSCALIVCGAGNLALIMTESVVCATIYALLFGFFIGWLFRL